jgi:hypothetical protein
VELVAPDALPQKPDWLTAAGEEVWMEDIGRASQVRLLSESDTTMFANYCNLQGCIIQAWRVMASGDPDEAPPPISALEHVRKLQEYFGIAGAKSRVVKVEQGGGPAGNPFSKFKR